MTNEPRDLDHCTTLLIDLMLGEHFQILGERREGTSKSAIQNQQYLLNKAV